jgi:trigger factor
MPVSISCWKKSLKKGIELSDEELDNHIIELSTSMGIDPDQARQNLAGVMDDFIYRLKIQKAIDYLVEHAVVTETKDDEEGADTVPASAVEVEPEA